MDVGPSTSQGAHYLADETGGASPNDCDTTDSLADMYPPKTLRYLIPFPHNAYSRPSPGDPHTHQLKPVIRTIYHLLPFFTLAVNLAVATTAAPHHVVKPGPLKSCRGRGGGVEKNSAPYPTWQSGWLG